MKLDQDDASIDAGDALENDVDDREALVTESGARAEASPIELDAGAGSEAGD